ncbi:hypothetical protein GPUN_2579 [Glaciecola punicea ACAM 611]|uniref:Motility protein n=1 Tax=Glaciecola punicea ACAM 611 TaxID=1121923 RepID=H5TEG7_9ALTE|nr:hypothetical protein [Glaciecola punicea]GAB56694.1 hypothetical protein GPUN_2579 [Glaciecola punicea ACAM 611]
MDMQGTSGVAQALAIRSAVMANNKQKQEEQAVLALLQSAPVSNTSSVGSSINTYA